MEKFYSIAAIFFFILIVAGCTPKEFLTPADLNEYVMDSGNGLKKGIEFNNHRIEVFYWPTDLWVHQETGDAPVDMQEVESLRDKYSQYYYFILSLSKDNKEALHQVTGGMSQYSELVQVLSFRMPEYTTLTTSAHDTIPVADFMLNRTYGLSASTDVLFVFSKEKAGGKEWVQFNLNEFGLGIGNQRFRFRREDLERAPKLKFSPMTND